MSINRRSVMYVSSVALALTLAACGGSSSPGPASPDGGAVAESSAAPAPGGAVLPVDSNPIVNSSTEQVLKIDSVLVENNVDPATGGDAPDHLEVALSNTGTTDLAGLEVFYTFVDASVGATESYYVKLPADFTVPAGGKRVAHFDNSGAPDHFPVNKFDLYHTSVNGLDVTVVVSAGNAAPQTMTVKKDPGDAETAD
jgi:hypothetical protein